MDHSEGGSSLPLRSAITDEVVAETGTEGLDFNGLLNHAPTDGGPAFHAMTLHQRASMVKVLAQAIMNRKEELHALTWATGATRHSGWIDIEGSAGALFTSSSQAWREPRDDIVTPNGDMEPIGKRGILVGQYVYNLLRGAAVHINAFKFPEWSMLEGQR